MLSNQPLIVIAAGRVNRHYLRDAWRQRHLLWVFSWRDITLRYKQTAAGVLWVLIRPLATMLIFSLVFGKFLKAPSAGIPFPLFILSGLIPWQLIAYSFAGASDGLFNYGSVVSKVYFPRIIVPLSAFAVNAVDFAVALLLLVPFLIYYGVTPDWRVFTLPLFALAGVPAAAGLGLWFAGVSGRYRDFRHVVPFVVTLSLYASPVGYSATIVGGELRFWYWLNPLVGVIEGCRWALFGDLVELYWPGMLASFALSLLLLWLGYVYFRAAERTVVDVL